MDPSAAALDFGALIETIATIVALLGVIASIYIARRGQKQDMRLAVDQANRAERAQKASEASADRAEATSRLTIDQMDRIAGALSEIASRSALGVGVAVPAPKVAWSLTHHGGDGYILSNVGTADAFNVSISAHESLMRGGGWEEQERMRPGDVLTFIALRTLGTSDSTITVHWADPPGGELDTWRYPLPPRPPR